MPALSVVIPLYNEEDNIAPLQHELAEALRGLDHEIVLVDDCSKDATLARIERGPEVRVIEFPKNTGQSAALYAGIQASRGGIIVLLDASWRNSSGAPIWCAATAPTGRIPLSNGCKAASRILCAADSRETGSAIPAAP
jgi:hypothetical protein